MSIVAELFARHRARNADVNGRAIKGWLQSEAARRRPPVLGRTLEMDVAHFEYQLRVPYVTLYSCIID